MALIARFPLPASLGGPTPPNLSNWQFQFNGLTFGPSTSFGYTKVTGLGMATIRHGDVSVPRDQGELIGLDLYGGQDVEIDFWMTGAGGLITNQLAFSSAFQIQPQGATENPLWFQLPNEPLMCAMCRTRNRALPWDAVYAGGAVGKPVVKLHATDPRVYSAGTSVSISLVSSGGGGLTFPVGPFPVTFGASSSGTTTVTNVGNVETRPIVIFNGPVTNPWIMNNSLPSAPYLQFSNPSQTGFTVLTGDQLVVDLGVPRRVLYYSGGILSGSSPSPAISWLTASSTWWDLVSGANLVRYGSQDTSVSGIGQAMVCWASAWQL